MKIGPTFARALEASSLIGGVTWDVVTGVLTFSNPDPGYQAAVKAILVGHDPVALPTPPAQPRRQSGNWIFAALDALGWFGLFNAAADAAKASKPLDYQRYISTGKTELVSETDPKWLRIAAAAAQLGEAATPAVAGISLKSVFDQAAVLSAVTLPVVPASAGITIQRWRRS